MSDNREAQVIDTFLAVTDTLVREFDALDMLTMLAERCVELLDVSAAGIILTDGTGPEGTLSVAAASARGAPGPSTPARVWNAYAPVSR